MDNSIFPKFSILRENILWEDYLMNLTPVEKIGDMWFKREDYFAPLGYGGINGMKLRQAIYMVSKNHSGFDRLISGASIKSPQLPMGSAVAKHFGLESMHVIGATNPNSAIKHENVKMATWFGAKFTFLKVGYNPVLQSKVNSVKSDTDFKLNYGITISSDEKREDIVSFYDVGANQVRNIPDNIETLLIPTGSGNSTISILYGLQKFRPKNLKRVVLFCISPSKVKFIQDRLISIFEHTGINTLNFNADNDSGLLGIPDDNALELIFIDLFSSGFTNYQEDVKFKYHSIDFHPTYEGKLMKYINLYLPELIQDNTMFWIIGSKPYLKNMEHIKSELGEIPNKVNIFENQWEIK